MDPLDHKKITDRIFFPAIAGFAGGVLLHSFIDFGAAFSLFFLSLSALIATLYFFQPDFGIHLRETALIPITATFLFAAGLGMLRYDIAGGQISRDSEKSVGKEITLSGIVADEPDERENNTRLVLKTEKGKFLLTVAKVPQFFYGDRIEVVGILERPKNFQDEKTMREVDYISHLSKDGIFYEMFRPKVKLLNKGKGNIVMHKLFDLKRAFLANVENLIPEPHASLLSGIIVGAKQSLGKDLLEKFRTVGVIHIVVLSGYNITIIARFIEWTLSRLKRNLRLIIAAAAMMLFALMVGASATVVRATVMALLVLLAKGTGRLYQVTRALLIAGAIMLVQNPKILVFDTSFQLSFLATLGLIYVSPLIETRAKWLPEKFHIKEIIIATVATQIFVLPYLLYKTGEFSVVSLPANLLILGSIPLTMMFGFLAGSISFISNLLALPFAYAAYFFLAFQLGTVEIFSNLRFASFSLPYFPFGLAVLFYAVYAIVLFIWHKKQSTVQNEANVSMIAL